MGDAVLYPLACGAAVGEEFVDFAAADGDGAHVAVAVGAGTVDGACGAAADGGDGDGGVGQPHVAVGAAGQDASAQCGAEACKECGVHDSAGGLCDSGDCYSSFGVVDFGSERFATAD